MSTVDDSQAIPTLKARGILFMTDPHLALNPVQDRLPGFFGQVLAKIEAGLALARERDLVPVILGDLFDLPRNNPKSLLKDLAAVLEPHKPWVLAGNHDIDKESMVLDPENCLARLHQAGVLRAMDRPGPWFQLRVQGRDSLSGPYLVGGTPSGHALPDRVHTNGCPGVVWTSHHAVAFRDFPDRPVKPHPIPGVDMLINGHMHRPQPSVQAGQTLWLNLGALARLKNKERLRRKLPCAHIWTPQSLATGELENVPLPHVPFDDIFDTSATDSGDD